MIRNEAKIRSIDAMTVREEKVISAKSLRLPQQSLAFKNTIVAGFAFIVLVFAAFNGVGAVEPLSSAELESHCAHYRMDPEGKDGIFCVRYIQGFIDGAVATDERVTLNVSGEYEKEESFSERAIRIRLVDSVMREGC